MTRYTAAVESAAALAASAPSGATANGLFANILSNTALGGAIKLRRLTLGIRATSAPPTSMQCTIGFARTTARGTSTSTVAWAGMEGYVGVVPPYAPGIDYAWSAVPTPYAGPGWLPPFFWEVSLNTQATADLPWELLEELQIQPAAANANGIALFNYGNALPTGHLYTAAVEVEI
jgi:hypothetical protein